MCAPPRTPAPTPVFADGSPQIMCCPWPTVPWWALPRANLRWCCNNWQQETYSIDAADGSPQMVCCSWPTMPTCSAPPAISPEAPVDAKRRRRGSSSSEGIDLLLPPIVVLQQVATSDVIHQCCGWVSTGHVLPLAHCAGVLGPPCPISGEPRGGKAEGEGTLTELILPRWMQMGNDEPRTSPFGLLGGPLPCRPTVKPQQVATNDVLDPGGGSAVRAALADPLPCV